VFLLSIRWRTY